MSEELKWFWSFVIGLWLIFLLPIIIIHKNSNNVSQVEQTCEEKDEKPKS